MAADPVLAPEWREDVCRLPDDAWRTRAACRGVDQAIFYDAHGRPDRAELARALCRACPVATECRETALVYGEKFGTWGGTSTAERRRIGKTTHGTPTRYNAGCRCTPCREAHRLNDAITPNEA